MNILVLNYEYPPLGGGAAPVCRDLAVGMAKVGHQVTVVTMEYEGLPAHEIKDGVEIYRLKCLRTKEHSCMPWEQLTYILATKRFLKSHLQEHQYGICHTHFVIPTGPIAVWIKKRYGIPFVITAHGSDVEGYNEKTYMKMLHRLLRPAWKRIVREAHTVVAPSEYLLKLMNRELQCDKYIRIPNGLDTNLYRSESAWKKKRILLMGRMQKAKNFQMVFNAVSMIPDEIWNGWKVDILGDGPYRKKLEQICNGLRISQRVIFHGWVENASSEQLNFLKQASIYISASLFENCPMAVLEAMAAGCYPLLSDIEGHRQFFQNENKEFFFCSDNEQELADKLTVLLGKKQQELCLNGIKTTNFDIKHIVREYLTLLERAATE